MPIIWLLNLLDKKQKAPYGSSPALMTGNCRLQGCILLCFPMSNFTDPPSFWKVLKLISGAPLITQRLIEEPGGVPFRCHSCNISAVKFAFVFLSFFTLDRPKSAFRTGDTGFQIP